jgi:hypothetical protein
LSKLALLDTSVWSRLRDGRLTGRAADRLYARLERGELALTEPFAARNALLGTRRPRLRAAQRGARRAAAARTRHDSHPPLTRQAKRGSIN